MTNTFQLIGEPESGPHYKVCKVPQGSVNPKIFINSHE